MVEICSVKKEKAAKIIGCHLIWVMSSMTRGRFRSINFFVRMSPVRCSSLSNSWSLRLLVILAKLAARDRFNGLTRPPTSCTSYFASSWSRP
jgi:hypothetical protein